MSKAKVTQDQSKIFIDKSGAEKSTLDPVLQRIRDIHIKEPITPQTFLQPIPPNLERVPEIQKKQVNMSGIDAKAIFDQKLAEAVKQLVELEKTKGMTKEDKGFLRSFISHLPSRGQFNIVNSVIDKDPVSFFRSLKQLDDEEKLAARKAEIKRREKLTSKKADLDEQIKASKELQKQYEEFKTNEKAKKVPKK